MKKYMIKKEAVPFILEKHANKIYDLSTWESIGICENALEEVKFPFLSYGFDKKGHTTLCGWSQEDGGHFEFTIHFPSIKYRDYDRFSKGRTTRALMDRINDTISNFYEQFIEDKIETNEQN